MTSKTEIITPKEAIEILEKHNPKNRSVSESTVQAYALDMKNGNWAVTHQGIAFDTSGNLIDGQHRLWACVFAGVPLKTLVFRDMPVEADGIFTMDAIDRNRPRTAGQQMQLCHNIKNGNVVAAALRSVAGICFPNVGSKRLSTASSLGLYELYGKDTEGMLTVLTSPMARVSYVTGPLTMFHKGEPEKAKQFGVEYVSLINMHQSVATARRYFEVHSGKKNGDQACRLMANAVLAYHRGKPLKKLHDTTEGVEFLCGMFPSTTKKVREIVTPVRVNISNHKLVNK